MLGYDLKWASFHIVEVMSSQKYHLKTVGYLAASQSFNQDTDVIMLTTNLLKKVSEYPFICGLFSPFMVFTVRICLLHPEMFP